MRPVPDDVRRARLLIRAHDRRAALRVLASDHGLDPSTPERTWLIAALWQDLGARDGALARAKRLPASPFAFAMQSFVTTQPRDALELLDSNPTRNPYHDLARAVAHAGLSDLENAGRYAKRAAGSDSAFVRIDAALVLSRVAMEQGKVKDAVAACTEGLRWGPWDARLHRQQAQIHRRAGQLGEAAGAFVAALHVSPRNEILGRDLAELWRQGLDAATCQQVSMSLAALGPDGQRNCELMVVLGLLRAESDPAGAAQLLEAALAAGAINVPVERELRLLQFRLGQYAPALALLRKALPPGTGELVGSLYAARWQRLWHVGAACPSPQAGPDKALELGRGLVRVGALEDAAAVLEHAGTRGTALRARVQGHLAFEEGMRRLIEQGYQSAATKSDPPDLDTVLAAIPALARTTLSADEAALLSAPDSGKRSMPLIGAWLDHRVRTASPLVQHFRRYGRYLMCGQRADTPVESIVFSIASLVPSREIRTGGRVYHHDVAIGYDRGSRSHVDAQGGSLGGACLLDSIWIDADSARYGEHSLRRSLIRDPAVVAWTLQSRPPAGHRFDLDDPGTVAVRLFQRYLARRGTDEWGSYYTLRAHEFGHVYDLRSYLPITENLLPAFGLLAGAGFSSSRMEMALERRAQLTACVDARDPDLALLEMILALPVTSPDPEVHDGGYRDGLADMVRYWHQHQGRYPAVTPGQAMVGQFDRLSNEQIRRMAFNVLRKK